MLNILTFDVMEYLDDNGIDYATSGENISPGWLGMNCVFCADPKNHMGIHLYSKSVSCWICGKHRLTDVIQAIENCSWQKVRQIIDRYQDRSMLFVDVPTRKLADVGSLPLGATKKFPTLHTEYLKNRGFDPEFFIRKYDLYATGVSGPYNYRIIFPIYLNRELVAFAGRDVTDMAEKRYKNSTIEESKIEPRNTIYNIDSVKDTAIAVEGFFDVMKIGDGTIGTLGTNFTKAQLALLSRIKHLFILFDSGKKDPMAPERAEKMAYDVSAVIKKVEILSLGEGDPADLSFKDVKALRHEVFLRG